MSLRERKKQRTRTALIDAALDLFLTQGYEGTTIEQITDAVEVSPRTFFRYFASKEDVALAVPREGQEIFLSEFVSRPREETPYQALSQAMRSMLSILRAGDAVEATRFLTARRVIEGDPVLLARQMCLVVESEQRLTAEVARRQGTDPCDLRDKFVVTVFMAIARICFEHGPHELDELARRMEETLSLADRSLRPGWDR